MRKTSMFSVPAGPCSGNCALTGEDKVTRCAPEKKKCILATVSLHFGNFLY